MPKTSEINFEVWLYDDRTPGDVMKSVSDRGYVNGASWEWSPRGTMIVSVLYVEDLTTRADLHQLIKV